MSSPFFFNSRKINGGSRVLSNDSGFYTLLSEREYGAFLKGRLKGSYGKELEEKQFLSDRLDFPFMEERLSLKYFSGWQGPENHIISLSSACDNSCLYCSASAGRGGSSLSRKNAEAVLDFIFSVPRKDYYLEFTGGEPFLNFPVMKFLVSEASARAVSYGKKARFSTVSNLLSLNSEKLEFLKKNNVAVCSSLDGPASLHRLTRGETYKKTVSGLKKIKKLAAAGALEEPSLITTVTRFSLGRHREIIDEYVRLGINRVQLGMLEPLGRAGPLFGDLGLSAEEYLKFYRAAFEYILELNLKKGIPVYEKGAFLLLYDIMNFRHYRTRAVDVFYRFAYDTGGNVYPSDELRMLGSAGDEVFRLGHASEGFEKVMKKEVSAAFLTYSLNNFLSPRCARCPYSVWCRVPVYYNYSAQNSFWGDMMTSQRCSIFMGIFDLLFGLLREKKYEKIFLSWLEKNA